MEIANRDVFASSATQSQYQDIAPLLEQTSLDAEFQKHDKSAIKAKRIYHRLGQSAIVLVALSAILTLAEALVFPNLFKNIILTYIAVTMAFIGIALQCYIIFTHQKRKWLLNRYATEFIRSLKFQSFVLAYRAKDTADLQTHVDGFAAKRLAALENDLNTGLAILSEFTPLKTLEKLAPFIDNMPSNLRLAETAQEAYRELRINYQRNFARNQIESFKSRRRVFNSSQDMIYLAAAAFAFISLGAKILGQMGTEVSTGWIDFTAVTLFILGATEAIMDNALLEEQSQARYEQYVRDIDDVLHTQTPNKVANPNQGSLIELVTDMERICLGELGDFCRAAERISYRF